LTPLSAPTGAYLPGVHIHAQVIAQLLDGRSVWVIARPAEAILVIFFFLVGLHASYSGKLSHHWVEAGLVLGYLVVTVVAFWAFKLIFPFVTVLLAVGMGLAGGHSGHGHEDGETSDAGHQHS
jgi:CHASE2 domain-containing sensor protein